MRILGVHGPATLRRICALLLGILIVVAGAPVMALDPGTPEATERPAGGDRRRLPADLVPSLEDAARIRPRAYARGCHAEKGDRTPSPCEFGDPDGDYTVVLIGDSHAVQWLPALEDIAEREGWKLYSMTKSACPLPDLRVTVRGARAPDCAPWRRAAFRLISRLHPDLVVAASLGRVYEVPGASSPQRRQRAWSDGWRRSLERLAAASERVVLLGDTPMWQQDPVACLRRHRRDIGRCDTPRSKAIATRTEAAERDAAQAAQVTWVPTWDLVCPGDPCRAVEGRHLVLRDIQHLTVAWARAIAPRLLERLSCATAPAPTPGMPGPSASPSAAPPGSPPPVASPSVAPGPSTVPGASTEPGPSIEPGPGPSMSPAAASASPAVSCPA